MTFAPNRPVTCLIGFIALATSVAGSGAYVAARMLAATHPDALALALTVDVVVLVPLAYHWLLVQGQGWPAVTTGIVFLGSLYVAHVLLPAGQQGLLQVLTIVAVPAEAALLAYVLTRAVRHRATPRLAPRHASR